MCVCVYVCVCVCVCVCAAYVPNMFVSVNACIYVDHYKYKLYNIQLQAHMEQWKAHTSSQLEIIFQTCQTSTNLIDTSQGLAQFMEDVKPTELNN